MKKCSRCQLVKASSDFYKDGRSYDGLNSACSQCMRAHHRTEKAKSVRKQTESYKSAPRKRKKYLKEWNLLTKYGISLADFNKKLIAQSGLCAICETPHHESHDGLHVDHDHSNGEIRGLLCLDCNLGLGKFKENKNILQSAADYLISFENKKRIISVVKES